MSFGSSLKPSFPRSWSYFAKHAPFAVAASALPGAVNYLIILVLIHHSGFAAAGEFRLLLSVFSLFGLISMIETRKIFIRSQVAGDSNAMRHLFIHRHCFVLTAFIGTILVTLVNIPLEWATIPNAILWIATLAVIIYTFDLYLPALQAGSRFRRLFLLELAKYGLALTAFLFVFNKTQDVQPAILAMLGIFAICHVIFFSRISRSQFTVGIRPSSIRESLRAPASRQARIYSFANILPASLEHIDKILVGWVFGLEILGIYTLAYSTSRLIYNMLKPSLYIYYRQFVDRLPATDVLIRTGIVFTLAGAIGAALFLSAIHLLPGMEKFRSGAIVTVILFLSYGIGMVRALFGQAYILNRQSDAPTLLRASVVASLMSLLLLFVALVSPPASALILLALQYPLRDGLIVALLVRSIPADR